MLAGCERCLLTLICDACRPVTVILVIPASRLTARDLCHFSRRRDLWSGLSLELKIRVGCLRSFGLHPRDDCLSGGRDAKMLMGRRAKFFSRLLSDSYEK